MVETPTQVHARREFHVLVMIYITTQTLAHRHPSMVQNPAHLGIQEPAPITIPPVTETL